LSFEGRPNVCILKKADRETEEDWLVMMMVRSSAAKEGAFYPLDKPLGTEERGGSKKAGRRKEEPAISRVNGGWVKEAPHVFLARS
jgi:hypothetical protein